MPTAYLKKLAKLNNISVNTLEKFWSQAKEIAKSEGQGNSWGLITSIFQNKLKKEGYKVKASTAQNKLDYINQVKECIKQIWARGTRNQQEQFAKEWVANYSRIIDDCLNAFEEPKVCARMMYIKYHKENPQTRDLNKNKDTDFYTLLKEAKQYFEGLKKWKEDFSDFDVQQNTIKAFKEETRTSESGQTFKFQRLSLSSIQKLLGYYLEDNEWDSNTHWNDLYNDNDGIVYIEYNDNKTFYSVTNPLLKDLKTTNIRNCIIEYPSYTAYFGKDCRIEKFDSREDSPYVVKSSACKTYLCKGKIVTASSKQEAIRKVNTLRRISKIHYAF